MNWKGQLQVLRGLEMKPNFSELSRKYSVDRRTIKKYWDGYPGKPKKILKPSKLDKHKDEIISKLSICGTNVKATYEYLQCKYPDIGTYSNFSKYVKKQGLFSKKEKIGHPRFETSPGNQAQVDWKENMTMVSRNGEVFTVNVFNLTLGYSRLKYFEYSKTKNQSDVFRCLYNAFKFINGVPEEILFDNMSTAALTHGKYKKVNPSMAEFAKQCGFTPKLCKVRHSYTKGKVESSNKFLTWLYPYQHDFENEEELVKIIEKINQKANNDISQATNMPPILLFQKEKEHLLPLPHHTVVESFIETKQHQVHKDGLVNFKGKRYSVDPKLIGENVTITETDNKLYIYYKQNLVTIHQISQNQINYKKGHYSDLIASAHTFKDPRKMDQLITENLSRFDKLL